MDSFLNSNGQTRTGSFKAARIIPALVVALLMPLSAGCINVPKTTALDASLPRTVINGYPFYTETYGNEDLPVVIVIHGGPGGDIAYLRPLKALSDQYRVIFYDQRGTGLSARENAANHTIDLFVEDLEAIIDRYSNGKPVRLIGHSWGGMLATAFVARHGEKVSHAVIAEPGMLTPDSAKAFLAAMEDNMTIWTKIKAVPYFIAAPFVKREDGHETKDYVMTKLLGLGRGAPYQCEGESLPEGSFRRAGFASFETMLMPYMKGEKTFDLDLTAGIGRYKGKLLLLSSECSFMGYDFQERHHRTRFPEGTRNVMMKNTGHNMITLRPEESIGIIRNFLGG